MQDNQNPSRVSLPIIAGVATALFALGLGAAWLTKHNIDSQNQQSQLSTTSPTTNPTQTLPGGVTNHPVNSDGTVTINPGQTLPQEAPIAIYWLNAAGDKVEGVPSSIIVDPSLKSLEGSTDVLNKAFQVLLTGRTDNSHVTTIPAGTKLLSLKVDKKGVYLNLSQEFTSGGGSTSMTARLGQVLYTATTLNPNLPVWIDVEGKPLEYLGGEGVMVDRPMTRTNFQQNFLSGEN